MSRQRRDISRSLGIAALLLLAPWQAARAEAWESTVTPFTPGSFPTPRPVQVKYGFGWNGFTAATADVRFSKAPGRLLFNATGGTSGLAKKLWDFEAKHSATADASSLRPLQVLEHETIRGKELTTALTFTPAGVISHREERKGSAAKSKTRQFEFPDVLSLNSAFLLLRSQALTPGSVQRVVVYPSTSAYLCTITARGHEQITVPTGSYDAIKLDLQLSKIGKKRELLPHKKFRGATVWLSDDSDRLVLRIETQVFIGTVFAELQSVQFDSAPATAEDKPKAR
ncbi:MAG: DUF3108 domain-containing protein [Chthoniobacterales bacterium]